MSAVEQLEQPQQPRQHSVYGLPRATESVGGTWIFAHSLGEPYSHFYAVNHECQIYSFAKRNFVILYKNGKIRFGCGRTLGVNDPKKTVQRVVLEVAMRSFFPQYAPVGLMEFRIGHIDGNHQNNSIFNLHWIPYFGGELKQQIEWLVVDPEDARDATKNMCERYKETLSHPPEETPSLQVIQHSIDDYGSFTNGWRDVIHEGLEHGLYKVNEKCEIFSLRIGRCLNQSRANLVLLKNVSDERKFLVNVRMTALRSFFPNKYDEFIEAYPLDVKTVDHVNGDWRDDRVANLQFLTRSENASKGPAVGRIITRNLASSDDLPGEIWQTSPALESISPGSGLRASNYGRVCNSKNRKTTGMKSRNPKHRFVYVATGNGKKRILVKSLVFAAFYNQVPPTKHSGFGIFHSLEAPLSEDGMCRNYPEDLSLCSMSVIKKEIIKHRECRKRSATEAGVEEEED